MVDVTTLDALIARFGLPAFVKIDVEGAEPAVLAGLTRAVPALSFEYLPRALDHVQACVTRLAALGVYRFNWSAGESYGLAEPAWLNDRELLEALRNKGAAAIRRCLRHAEGVGADLKVCATGRVLNHRPEGLSNGCVGVCRPTISKIACCWPVKWTPKRWPPKVRGCI